jgi:hypothetical protein
MLIFLIKILTIILILNKTDCCGISTHIEIGHRAASHYDYMIDNQTSILEV